MHRIYLAFLRGITANRISRTGVTLTTAAFFSFIGFEGLRFLGLATNAYMGLLTYLALPLVFMIGLVMIPFGWWRHSRKVNRPFWDLLSKHATEEDEAAISSGQRVFRLVMFLTIINVIFIGAVGGRTLHFMDEAHFCGTACHSVMGPEWATYQASPHAHVKCVECHVGEGAHALINAKLNGAWQMISASLRLYESPIPTPVHTLRPARETCEKCHWPDKFHGNIIVNRIHFDTDEQNTPRYTTLLMKVGTGQGGAAAGSHWHVAPENEVRYASLKDERETMIWVEVRQPNGTYKRFENVALDAVLLTDKANERVMDCVDCHNRATHIYENPRTAIDARMSRGEIPIDIPFIKERALGGLTGSYSSNEQAFEMIRTGIMQYYTRYYPDVFENRSEELEGAAETLQNIYARNIHPGMEIDWGVYRSHLGHREGPGCFRCHTPSMVDEEGISISMECTLCHSILAIDADRPFDFLQSASVSEGDPKEIDSRRYLNKDFWESFSP